MIKNWIYDLVKTADEKEEELLKRIEILLPKIREYKINSAKIDEWVNLYRERLEEINKIEKLREEALIAENMIKEILKDKGGIHKIIDDLEITLRNAYTRKSVVPAKEFEMALQMLEEELPDHIETIRAFADAVYKQIQVAESFKIELTKEKVEEVKKEVREELPMLEIEKSSSIKEILKKWWEKLRLFISNILSSFVAKQKEFLEKLEYIKGII
jgi:hypothetical protein